MSTEEKKSSPIVQVTRSSMPDFAEYAAEIKDLWDSHHLTNMGRKHQLLEAALADYLSVPNITLFANGHLALEAILTAFGLAGEVITTPFTFASTTHAIVRCGLQPVFCDIDSEDYTLDPGLIESKITAKTCAILPVHVYGHVCQVGAIDTIASRHNLKVIYDAAHAFGVTVNGTSVGRCGDAAMFSFHATKVFNTIEGGAVTYRDPSLCNSLDQLKNFGITGPETVERVGGNAKMNEFQAAMGLCNLRHLDEQLALRRAVDLRYREHLDRDRGIRLPVCQAGVSGNFAYFPVVFEAGQRMRNNVFNTLRQHDIMARKYFFPMTSQFVCYANRFDPQQTPVARRISESVLCLPIYADLPLDAVDRICGIVREVIT
jgi:dTDP-4-amino-4,6-dideoxygalactose transaminase